MCSSKGTIFHLMWKVPPMRIKISSLFGNGKTEVECAVTWMHAHWSGLERCSRIWDNGVMIFERYINTCSLRDVCSVYGEFLRVGKVISLIFVDE